MVIAIALLALSVTISIGFSLSTQRGEHFYIAKSPILPGTHIDPSQITLTRASLGSQSSMYFTSKDEIVNHIAQRLITPGEILFRSSISNTDTGEAMVLVPFSVRSVDIPDSAVSGDVVNLFWVLDSRNDQLFEPEEIARNIFIQSIDRRGSNFGSDLAITVSVGTSQVQKLLSYTSGGRIVVVPSRG